MRGRVVIRSTEPSCRTYIILWYIVFILADDCALFKYAKTCYMLGLKVGYTKPKSTMKKEGEEEKERKRQTELYKERMKKDKKIKRKKEEKNKEQINKEEKKEKRKNNRNKEQKEGRKKEETNERMKE